MGSAIGALPARCYVRFAGPAGIDVQARVLGADGTVPMQATAAGERLWRPVAAALRLWADGRVPPERLGEELQKVTDETAALLAATAPG